MTSISELRDKLEIYDHNRGALLRDLVGLSSEQLRRRPDPGNWSILEILQHMVLSEREVLEFLPEPKDFTARKRTLRARLFYLIVLLVLKWSIPVPVPSDGMVPDGNTSLSQLIQQWDENISWLRGYLDSLRPEDLVHAVFRHPVAGPLTVTQAARMAKLHFDAHHRQIRKVKAQVMSGLAAESENGHP